MPASPVSWACDAIVNASRLHEESNGGDAVLISAARTIMDLFYGSDKCIGNQGVQGPGNTPGDGTITPPLPTPLKTSTDFTQL